MYDCNIGSTDNVLFFRKLLTQNILAKTVTFILRWVNELGVPKCTIITLSLIKMKNKTEVYQTNLS